MTTASDVIVTTPRGRRWLVWIIALTILGRGLYGIRDYRIHGMEKVGYYWDAGEYVVPAVNLVRHGHYVGNDGLPEIRRIPGMVPLLLPGILLNQIIPVTFILHLILGGLTVYLTWILALQFTGRESVALIAAGFIAQDAGCAIYTSRLFSEILFLTVILGIYLLLLQYLRTGRIGTLVALGVLMGYAPWVRPITIALPIALLPIICYCPIKRGQKLSVTAGRTVLFIVLALTPTGAWYYRNVAVADFHGFTSVAGYNQYFFKGLGLKAHHEKRDLWALGREWGSMDLDVYLTRHPEQIGWTPAQRAEWQWEEGSRIVKAEWPLSLALHLRGMQVALTTPFHKDPFTVAVGWLSILLAALGLILPVWRRSRCERLALLTCFLYLWFMSGGPGSVQRFRIPLLPLIGISASASLIWLMEYFRRRGLAEGEPAV